MATQTYRLPKFVATNDASTMEAIAATKDAMVAGEEIINRINQILDTALDTVERLMQPAKKVIADKARADATRKAKPASTDQENETKKRTDKDTEEDADNPTATGSLWNGYDVHNFSEETVSFWEGPETKKQYQDSWKFYFRFMSAEDQKGFTGKCKQFAEFLGQGDASTTGRLADA